MVFLVKKDHLHYDVVLDMFSRDMDCNTIRSIQPEDGIGFR